jgi:hypothetical protein
MATVNLTTSTASGVAVTYAVSSGSLPSGMTLNSNTGVISGTPSTTGYNVNGVTSTFDITATNGLGNATVRSFTITRFWNDGTSVLRAGRSAWQIKNDTGTISNGTYYININNRVRLVFCDMSTDDGGWMRIVNGNNTSSPPLAQPSRTDEEVLNPSSGRGKYSDDDIQWLLLNAPHNTGVHSLKVIRMRAGASTDYFQVPAGTVWNTNVSRSQPLIRSGWDTYVQFTSSPNTVSFNHTSGSISGNYTYPIIGSYMDSSNFGGTGWGQRILYCMSAGRDSWYTGSADTNDAEVYLR